MGIYLGSQPVSTYTGGQKVKEVTIADDGAGNVTIEGLSVIVDEEGNATINLGE